MEWPWSRNIWRSKILEKSVVNLCEGNPPPIFSFCMLPIDAPVGSQNTTLLWLKRWALSFSPSTHVSFSHVDWVTHDMQIEVHRVAPSENVRFHKSWIPNIRRKVCLPIFWFIQKSNGTTVREIPKPFFIGSSLVTAVFWLHPPQGSIFSTIPSGYVRSYSMGARNLRFNL